MFFITLIVIVLSLPAPPVSIEQIREQGVATLSSGAVVPGLDGDDFRQRFGVDCLEALPQLHELLTLGLARQQGSLLSLTTAGVERADTIGPWLTSAPIAERMQQSQVG